ncbi:MAG: hypothetical protein ABI667_01970 [Sphingomicrobium sp.]
MHRKSPDEQAVFHPSSFRSLSWHSLNFEGERHCISLRIPAADADLEVHMLPDGLEDAEIPIPGHALADISVERQTTASDGSVTLEMEALTI